MAPPSSLFARFLELGDELEVATRREFFSEEIWQAQNPADEVYEWQALLDALAEASGTFAFLELGAGIGQWTIRAAAAVRRYRPELRYRLVAVEADPVHFEWLRKHARDNGVSHRSRAGSLRLVEAAVSGRPGEYEDFFTGNAAAWYGQTLVRPYNAGWQGASIRVKTVRLSELLRPLERVDLIHFDIQGAELEVLSEARPEVGRVRRIYVETHSETVDEQVPQLFAKAEGDWSQLVAVPFGAPCQTPLGEANFPGGVQLWRNEL